MNNRTMAHGGGTPRIIDGHKVPFKTAAHGERVAVECRDIPSPFNNFIPPYPRPWPFDPTQPNHSASRDLYRKVRRWLDNAPGAYVLGETIGWAVVCAIFAFTAVKLWSL